MGLLDSGSGFFDKVEEGLGKVEEGIKRGAGVAEEFGDVAEEARGVVGGDRQVSVDPSRRDPVQTSPSSGGSASSSGMNQQTLLLIGIALYVITQS